MSDLLIQVNQISKSFGVGANRREVLKDIAFDVHAGEFVSVMGPSGCGKSTLLYLIGGLDHPDQGVISVCGKDIAKLNDAEKSRMRRQEVGFIFQFYNLVPNLTVKENILLPVIMDGLSPTRYRKKLSDLLSVIGMESKQNSFPTELSGGQQQRVAIARALIMEPKVLLADEPTGNLDRKSGEEIMKLFARMNKDLGVTVLQVTHSDSIASYGGRTITLSDGVIQSDLCHQPLPIEG